MNTQEYFEKNRYIYLANVIGRDECDKLTEYMQALDNEGKLVKDEQCPLSGSVYGDPIFDSILEKLAEPLSKQLGVELLPAYTYARLYAPGETLVRHKDREACEISGTLTLGFDPGSGKLRFSSIMWIRMDLTLILHMMAESNSVLIRMKVH